VLSPDRVAAERVLPHGAGAALLARSSADPVARTMLELADLVIRIDAAPRLPSDVLGPHLTIIDLHDDEVSDVRRQAMAAGALTFNRRDVEAYRLELGLSQVLGGPVGVEPILALFHAL
jgi:hypothetical protein